MYLILHSPYYDDLTTSSKVTFLNKLRYLNAHLHNGTSYSARRSPFRPLPTLQGHQTLFYSTGSKEAGGTRCERRTKVPKLQFRLLRKHLFTLTKGGCPPTPRLPKEVKEGVYPWADQTHFLQEKARTKGIFHRQEGGLANFFKDRRMVPRTLIYKNNKTRTNGPVTILVLLFSFHSITMRFHKRVTKVGGGQPQAYHSGKDKEGLHGRHR